MSSAKPDLPVAPIEDAVPAIRDRRTDDRVHTVFRVARAITAIDEGLARIRNMSDRGAGLRMLIPVTLSDSLTLELVDGVELRGQVVWQRDDEFGLEFDQPISSTELLANLAAGSRCGRTRPVRLPVAATALTRSERGLRSVRLVDISQRGLKLEHDGSLTKGLDLKVTLPSGLDLHGIVRWTRDNRAGVMLLEPLSVEALGSVRSLMRPTEPLIWLPGTQRHLLRP